MPQTQTMDRLDVVAEVMESRHSARSFDSTAKMSREDLNEILTLASKAPSSWNLQHWRYLVITSQEQKERVLPIAYNQRQVVDAAATIVILGDLEANKSATEIYGGALKAGAITQEVHDYLINSIEGAYQSSEIAQREAVLNASLSAMQLMLAAKAKGYDTCPMGGFDREALIKELNIPARYTPVMLIPIGKTTTSPRMTPRFPLEKLVIEEKF